MERPEGYQPRYLRGATKQVAFDLPGTGTGKDDGVARTPSAGSADPAEPGESHDQKNARTQEEHKVRERARKRKAEIAAKQNKGKADQHAGQGDAREYELYQGQVLPQDAAIMTKKVNARRQNSNHGLRNAGLVTG